MNRLRQWIARAGRSTWNNWPLQAYAHSSYRHRLAAVERHLREGLDRAPAGNVRIVSLCAGDGRDVMGVVEGHPRRDDVSAWLVESDGNSVEAGVARARAAGLQRTVQFRHADASTYSTYVSMAPADVLLVCGVWGHVPPEDRPSVVDACRVLCLRGGRVIWTRGVGRGMTRFEEIRALFTQPHWEQSDVTITPDANWAVATHRSLEPAKAPKSGRIFHFRTAAG
jgi:hypothetical protein